MRGRASNGDDRRGISGVEPEGESRRRSGRVVWRLKETACGPRGILRQVARPYFFLLLMAVSVTAATVTLAWDQSPDPRVVGYNLYWGGGTRNYTNVLDVYGITNTTCSVSNLISGGTYFFAATCYNDVGLESDFSVEVSYTVPPPNTNQPPTTPVIRARRKP